MPPDAKLTEVAANVIEEVPGDGTGDEEQAEEPADRMSQPERNGQKRPLDDEAPSRPRFEDTRNSQRLAWNIACKPDRREFCAIPRP